MDHTRSGRAEWHAFTMFARRALPALVDRKRPAIRYPGSAGSWEANFVLEFVVGWNGKARRETMRTVPAVDAYRWPSQKERKVFEEFVKLVKYAVAKWAVHALDPRVPILWLRTLEDVSATEAAPITAVASGLAALGFVALALAALGLFGVLSFIVAQRRSEIGIRVALGARSVNVIWMVVRQALSLGAGGVLAGGLLAVGAVTLMRVVIHGLEPLDMTMFGAIAATMLLVALAASALPAWRAASVDPMQSLRED